MSEEENPPEKGEENVVQLRPISGGKAPSDGPNILSPEDNRKFRKWLGELLGDTDVDFSDAVLVLGSQRRILFTRNILSGVALLEWAKHGLLNFEQRGNS
jgi:hypothetical protein